MLFSNLFVNKGLLWGRIPWLSVGIELIFFLVAGVVLCFGFRMRITLGALAYWHFSLCWAVLTLSQGRFSLSCCPASWEQTGRVKGGGHKELEGKRNRTTDPNWPKGCPIPYPAMLKNKTREAGSGRSCCCLKLAGHQSTDLRVQPFGLPGTHWANRNYLGQHTQRLLQKWCLLFISM